MELVRDEGCALRVARALHHIDFSVLEKWYDRPGFIKLFEALKEEGSDQGWALMLGAIECASAGDHRQPNEVMGHILRENRLRAQHLYSLYPDCPPVRHHADGLRVHRVEPPPERALPEMDAAVQEFGHDQLGLDGLCDRLYFLHTSEMRDTLYYHALLTAKSVRHSISSHMLWKALSLLPPGNLSDEAMERALGRLERCQAEQLSACLAVSPSGTVQVPLGQLLPWMPALPSAEAAPMIGPASALGAPSQAAPYSERAERFLQSAGVATVRGKLSRLATVSGYNGARLEQLLEPFLLRCYPAGNGSAAEDGLMLAVGPPEVDKPALLRAVAQLLGLKFMHCSYAELRSSYRGELEGELIRILARAGQQGEPAIGRPSMLVFSDAPPSAGLARAARGRPWQDAPPSVEVVETLCAILAGPRRREAFGEMGPAPVITVAAMPTAPPLEPSLRGQMSQIPMELPGPAELERLLIREVVGRHCLCDLDGISFSRLGEEAAGLAPADIARVAQLAKLRALNRRAWEMSTRLEDAPDALRAAINLSYLITQDDLSAVISAQKSAPRCTATAVPAAFAAQSAARTLRRHCGQTDLDRWTEAEQPWERPPRRRTPSHGRARYKASEDDRAGDAKE